jgi:hypothetical protein
LTERGEDSFSVRKDRSNRLRPCCGDCSKDSQRARYGAYKRDSYFKHKCSRAKSRSQYLKVPFDLTPEYLESIWTGDCPILKVEIKKETNRLDDYAAELDRFHPERGYVKGNVFFLSRRINRIKNDAKIDELIRLVEWMKCVVTI